MHERWETGGPIFIDRDPAGFSQLIRYLRQGLPSASLPRDDTTLFTSTCLEAEFFGVSGLLKHIKVRVARNLQPSLAASDEQAVAFFDQAHGSVSAALEKGLLPRRYFEALKPDGPVGRLRVRCGTAYLFLRIRDGAEEFVVVKYDEWREGVRQELKTADEELALPLLLGMIQAQRCRSIVLERYTSAVTRNALGFPEPPLCWEDDLAAAKQVASIYHHAQGADTPPWFSTTCLDDDRGMRKKVAAMLRSVDAGGITDAGSTAEVA